MSVANASLDKFDDNWKPNVFPKSKQTRDRIAQSVKKAFMFSGIGWA